MRRAACEEKEWGNGGRGKEIVRSIDCTCLQTRADVKVESEQVF